MIKRFIWILLLFGCHSNSDTESHLKTSSLADTVKTLTLENKNIELKKSAKLFDNHQPFEIISFTNSLNKHTTDTDSSKCNSWALTKPEIEKIIKNSESIDGTTWDLSFLVLTCTKSVSIVQSGQQFKLEINAASFFSISNGDTTVLFGDYKKSDRKYFIEAPDAK
jgi:hypothetical protein